MQTLYMIDQEFFFCILTVIHQTGGENYFTVRIYYF